MEQICAENRQRIDKIADEVARESAECKTTLKDHERRLGTLEENSKKQSEILVTLQKQADAIESMNGKIDNFSDKVDEKFESITGRVENAVNRFDTRISELEKEPGEKWKKLSFEIIKYIALAVAGVVCGYFISKGGV